MNTEIIDLITDATDDEDSPTTNNKRQKTKDINNNSQKSPSRLGNVSNTNSNNSSSQKKVIRDPNNSNKKEYSEAEDKIISDYCFLNESKLDCWSRVVTLLKESGYERTAIEVRERWLNDLDPTLNKGPWNEKENDIIILWYRNINNGTITIKQYSELKSSLLNNETKSNRSIHSIKERVNFFINSKYFRSTQQSSTPTHDNQIKKTKGFQKGHAINSKKKVVRGFVDDESEYSKNNIDDESEYSKNNNDDDDDDDDDEFNTEVRSYKKRKVSNKKNIDDKDKKKSKRLQKRTYKFGQPGQDRGMDVQNALDYKYSPAEIWSVLESRYKWIRRKLDIVRGNRKTKNELSQLGRVYIPYNVWTNKDRFSWRLKTDEEMKSRNKDSDIPDVNKDWILDPKTYEDLDWHNKDNVQMLEGTDYFREIKDILEFLSEEEKDKYAKEYAEMLAESNEQETKNAAEELSDDNLDDTIVNETIEMDESADYGKKSPDNIKRMSIKTDRFGQGTDKTTDGIKIVKSETNQANQTKRICKVLNQNYNWIHRPLDIIRGTKQHKDLYKDRFVNIPYDVWKDKSRFSWRKMTDEEKKSNRRKSGIPDVLDEDKNSHKDWILDPKFCEENVVVTLIEGIDYFDRSIDILYSLSEEEKLQYMKEYEEMAENQRVQKQIENQRVQRQIESDRSQSVNTNYSDNSSQGENFNDYDDTHVFEDNNNNHTSTDSRKKKTLVKKTSTRERDSKELTDTSKVNDIGTAFRKSSRERQLSVRLADGNTILTGLSETHFLGDEKKGGRSTDSSSPSLKSVTPLSHSKKKSLDSPLMSKMPVLSPSRLNPQIIEKVESPSNVVIKKKMPINDDNTPNSDDSFSFINITQDSYHMEVDDTGHDDDYNDYDDEYSNKDDNPKVNHTMPTLQPTASKLSKISDESYTNISKPVGSFGESSSSSIVDWWSSKVKKHQLPEGYRDALDHVSETITSAGRNLRYSLIAEEMKTLGFTKYFTTHRTTYVAPWAKDQYERRKSVDGLKEKRDYFFWVDDIVEYLKAFGIAYNENGLEVDQGPRKREQVQKFNISDKGGRSYRTTYDLKESRCNFDPALDTFIGKNVRVFSFIRNLKDFQDGTVVCSAKAPVGQKGGFWGIKLNDGTSTELTESGIVRAMNDYHKKSISAPFKYELYFSSKSQSSESDEDSDSDTESQNDVINDLTSKNYELKSTVKDLTSQIHLLKKDKQDRQSIGSKDDFETIVKLEKQVDKLEKELDRSRQELKNEIRRTEKDNEKSKIDHSRELEELKTKHEINLKNVICEKNIEKDAALDRQLKVLEMQYRQGGGTMQSPIRSSGNSSNSENFSSAVDSVRESNLAICRWKSFLDAILKAQKLGINTKVDSGKVSVKILKDEDVNGLVRLGKDVSNYPIMETIKAFKDKKIQNRLSSGALIEVSFQQEEVVELNRTSRSTYQSHQQNMQQRSYKKRVVNDAVDLGGLLQVWLADFTGALGQYRIELSTFASNRRNYGGTDGLFFQPFSKSSNTSSVLLPTPLLDQNNDPIQLTTKYDDKFAEEERQHLLDLYETVGKVFNQMLREELYISEKFSCYLMWSFLIHDGIEGMKKSSMVTLEEIEKAIVELDSSYKGSLQYMKSEEGYDKNYLFDNFLIENIFNPRLDALNAIKAGFGMFPINSQLQMFSKNMLKSNFFGIDMVSPSMVQDLLDFPRTDDDDISTVPPEDFIEVFKQAILLMRIEGNDDDNVPFNDTMNFVEFVTGSRIVGRDTKLKVRVMNVKEMKIADKYPLYPLPKASTCFSEIHIPYVPDHRWTPANVMINIRKGFSFMKDNFDDKFFINAASADNGGINDTNNILSRNVSNNSNNSSTARIETIEDNDDEDNNNYYYEDEFDYYDE